MIHTIIGFGIINEAEVDVFWESPCFFYDPTDVAISPLVFLPFLHPVVHLKVLGSHTIEAYHEGF